MATCKNCGKSGLFLTLTTNGLCPNCDAFFINYLQNRVKQINESTVLIQQSSNVDTIVSRFDFIVKILNEFLDYEKKGITTTKQPPSESLKIMNREERDRHIAYGLEKELEKLKSVLPTLATTKGKFNRLQKYYLRMLKYKSEMIDQTEIIDVEKELIQMSDEVGGIVSLRKINRTNQVDLSEMHRKSLENYVNSSDVIKGVQVLASQDSCAECKNLTEITYLLSEKIPELPHPECTHEKGCRCTYIPITKSLKEIAK